MVEIDLTGRSVFAGALTQVPAQVTPCMRSPISAGSGRHAATTSRGATRAAPPATSLVESRPSMWMSLQHADELVTEAVLEGDAAPSIHRGTRRTSSCSTFTHSTGPIPAGKLNVSGSLNGSVVNHPLSFSQRREG